MSRPNLLGYTSTQLQSLFSELGEKPFRGKQLYKWLYNTRLYDFDRMTDLPTGMRDRLAESYRIQLLELDVRNASTDGTEKFLFRLSDSLPIELVRIPDEDRTTICISSQSGCALACKFCATGKLGFKRSLTVGELVGQVMYVRDLYGEDAFTNIVFMGMGEPFMNYDNVVEALKIMSDPTGMAIPARKITVSTVGIVPNMIKFADSGLKARLALSLHSAIQEKREQIVPSARKYHLDDIMAAARYYTEKSRQRIYLEYVLLDGVNDSKEDALAIVHLIEGLQCKINILSYNAVEGLGFKSPTAEKVDWFAKFLYPRAPAVTVRKSRGADIAAACGQLAARSE